jgi:hypothetical protein
MMNYFLMKFTLPPAALEEHANVLDSVFVLHPKFPNAGISFVQKIFSRIRARKEFFEQG